MPKISAQPLWKKRFDKYKVKKKYSILVFCLGIALYLFIWLHLFFNLENSHIHQSVPISINTSSSSNHSTVAFAANSTNHEVTPENLTKNNFVFRTNHLETRSDHNDIWKDGGGQVKTDYYPIFSWPPTPKNSSYLTLPLSVLERYQMEHSADKLQSEYESCLKGNCDEFNRRKYAIGYYACPHQAGNRLHHFMNSLLWSIVTNRTMLYKYYDRSDCLRVHRGEGAVCLNLAELETCNSILRIAPWIPSYDEWKHKLNLGVPDEVSFYSTHLTPFSSKNQILKKFPLEDGFKIHEGIDLSTKQFLHFGDLYDKAIGETVRINRRKIPLLNTTVSKHIAHELLAAGDDFTYGMIFNASFLFNASLFPDLQDDQYNMTTIAIHSRHSQQKDDGSDINTEVVCLRKVLPSEKKCRIYIMTDRVNTMKKLISAGSTQFNCSIEYVPPTALETSWRKEHGPFAGTKFYEDLLKLSIEPKDILIYKKARTSSFLLQELLVYNQLTHVSYPSRPLLICQTDPTKRKAKTVEVFEAF